jgi:Zn-dependent protease
MDMLIQLLFTNPQVFFMAAIGILLALSMHEYAHAWMAYYLGDSTAKEQGRLTINPLAHLDPIGTIMLLIVGFGWGKPVPFNPYNLKNQKWGPAWVALAGPMSNFLMAISIGLLFRIFQISNPSIIFFFGFFVWINLILGVFNLMPIPPLDGSHIFLALFQVKQSTQVFLQQNSILLLLGGIFFMMYIGIPYILKPLFTLITGMPSFF